jgi:hypothetical protein
LIARFNVESIVVFDSMPNVNSESARHVSEPSNIGDFIPRNLFFLPQPANEKALGTQFPIDGSIDGHRSERSKKEKSSADFGREVRGSPQGANQVGKSETARGDQAPCLRA